ncbi:MAG: LysE family translocator [Ferruginibacter sp.]
MEFKIWLTYLLTEIVLIITPGPNVFLVSAQGMKYGLTSGGFGSLGVASGSLIYFILTVLGLNAFILTAGNLFEYIKIAGAVYLSVTGFIMIYNSYKISFQTNVHLKANQKNLKSFVQGFIIQTANPKTIIFFIALLPQFINSTKNTGIQFIILGVTTIILEIFILIGYSWLGAKGKKLAEKNITFIKWQDRISGLVLIALGANLIFIQAPTTRLAFLSHGICTIC